MEYFFLLFHGLGSLEKGGSIDWQQPFLRRFFLANEVSFVNSARYLRADSQATGTPLCDYFIQKGTGKGHYNDLGNRAVFAAIEDGLRGEYEGVWTPAPEGR